MINDLSLSVVPQSCSVISVTEKSCQTELLRDQCYWQPQPPVHPGLGPIHQSSEARGCFCASALPHSLYWTVLSGPSIRKHAYTHTHTEVPSVPCIFISSAYLQHRYLVTTIDRVRLPLACLLPGLGLSEDVAVRSSHLIFSHARLT